MCVCKGVCIHQSQDNLWEFFLSFYQVDPGFELKLWGLVASAFPTESPQCPLNNLLLYADYEVCGSWDWTRWETPQLSRSVRSVVGQSNQHANRINDTVTKAGVVPSDSYSRGPQKAEPREQQLRTPERHPTPVHSLLGRSWWLSAGRQELPSTEITLKG